MTGGDEETRDARSDALRRRMDVLNERAAGAAAGADDRARAILEDRARTLARPAIAPPPLDAFAVVSVRIAKEHYGVEAGDVLEVIGLADLAPLPGAELPAFAVTAWRGELLLLLDIRRALGLSSTALNDLRHVVVVAGEPAPVGIMVDEVVGMVTIRRSDVRPIGTTPVVGREFVRGVTSSALSVLETSALSRISE